MTSIASHGKQKHGSGNYPRISFVKSQAILLRSRAKFALLYSLATVTGLLCFPGVLTSLSSPSPDLLIILQLTLPLPLASLLVTAGTYILNDLVDVELDRANGKKRPIPSGQVSKKQASAFIALAFTTAFLLAVITFKPISMIIIGLMLFIGIAYSAPKVALMKRFVIKTVSIALFYTLCALLGMTSAFNIDFAINNPFLVGTVLSTLALMVFVSSTLNDMGDINGDRIVGRRTIPIVIGIENAIKLTLFLVTGVLIVLWVSYAASVLAGGQAGSLTTITTSSIALFVMITLRRMRRSLHDPVFLRKQHKRLFPLQMSVHPSLAVGVLMI